MRRTEWGLFIGASILVLASFAGLYEMARTVDELNRRLAETEQHVEQLEEALR